MNRFIARNRIAFISSYPPKAIGMETLAQRPAEALTLSPYACIDPVFVVLQSDVSERYDGDVVFVIHKEVRSDYRDAADLINNENITRVELELEFRLLSGEANMGIEVLLRYLRVPVVTTLLSISENPSPSYFQRLVDVCNASWKIIVANQHGIELLKNKYRIDGHKLEQMAHEIEEIPLGVFERSTETSLRSPYEKIRKPYSCRGFYG